MSKVVFLDVDGVLNYHHPKYGTREKSPMGFRGVGEKYLLQLKYLVEETGAQLVLSSDWKDCFYTDNCDPKKADEDGAYLAKRLADHNLTLVAKTDDRPLPEEHTTGRGYGIRKYLNQHPEVTSFVILDDFNHDFKAQDLLDHFVLLKYPLTKRSADKAIKVLQKE